MWCMGMERELGKYEMRERLGKRKEWDNYDPQFTLCMLAALTYTASSY